ncbi:MAG TPA: hypothetical protein VFW07_18365 [Parafilimonas sp.]|nr:hypothetical protein [Parafilimonas sp.]
MIDQTFSFIVSVQQIFIIFSSFHILFSIIYKELQLLFVVINYIQFNIATQQHRIEPIA